MKVREFIKQNFPKEWKKAQQNKDVEINLLPEDVIYGCWECGESDCETGVHLSTWKPILEYISQEDCKGWYLMQVGDGFSSKFIGNTYIPDNWEHEFALDLSSEELLEMDIDQLWKLIERYFGCKIDGLDKHNREQILKYEQLSGNMELEYDII